VTAGERQSADPENLGDLRQPSQMVPDVRHGLPLARLGRAGARCVPGRNF